LSIIRLMLNDLLNFVGLEPIRPMDVYAYDCDCSGIRRCPLPDVCSTLPPIAVEASKMQLKVLKQQWMIFVEIYTRPTAIG
jgi:hypothetical protein